jgi:hypothetical protein
MRRISLAVAVVIAACGAPQGISLGSSPGASDTGEESEQLVCAPETLTGTNINRMVCRSRSDIENDKKAARDFRSRSGIDPARRRR